MGGWRRGLLAGIKSSRAAGSGRDMAVVARWLLSRASALQDGVHKGVHLRYVHDAPPAGSKTSSKAHTVGERFGSGCGPGAGRKRSAGTHCRSCKPTHISQQQMTAQATKVWCSLQRQAGERSRRGGEGEDVEGAAARAAVKSARSQAPPERPSDATHSLWLCGLLEKCTTPNPRPSSARNMSVPSQNVMAAGCEASAR